MSTWTTGWSEQIPQNRPNCTPRQPSGCSSFLAGSSTTRSPISHQVETFSSSGCSSTLNCFTVAPLPKMRLKVQSVHQHWMTDLNITARDLHRLLGMLVFMASPTRMAAFSSGPMVGRHIMVPEDRELVQPDPSSSVGSVRGGLVGISSSPARSTPRHHGAGSNSLRGCIQFGLGSPVRLTLGHRDSGQHFNNHGTSTFWRCRPSSMPWETSYFIWGPGWLLDVLQRSDCGLHQELGGHKIATLMQMTIWLLKWCDRKAIMLVPVHLQECTTSRRIPCPELARHWPRSGTTRVCQVGWTTDRLVCDIRQQTTGEVRIAISWPQGRVDRCHVHALGQREGPTVRVPAIQGGPSSTAEDRSVTRSESDFDCSTATSSVVVSRVDGSPPRGSDPAVRRGSRPADTRRLDGRRGDRDSSLPTVKSTCVETLRAILRAKSHSREAANMMSRCLRKSSWQVYEIPLVKIRGVL